MCLLQGWLTTSRLTFQHSNYFSTLTYISTFKLIFRHWLIFQHSESYCNMNLYFNIQNHISTITYISTFKLIFQHWVIFQHSTSTSKSSLDWHINTFHVCCRNDCDNTLYTLSFSYQMLFNKELPVEATCRWEDCV